MKNYGANEQAALKRIDDLVSTLPPEARKNLGELHELRALVVRDPSAKTVIIPEGMPLAVAAIFVVEKMKSEEEMVEVEETIDAYPLDAAHCLYLAIQELFGFHQLKAKRGFFGDDPPKMVSVATGVNTTTQVPWGGFGLPGIEGRLETQSSVSEKGRMVMVVCGQIKRKNHPQIMALIARTRELLKTHSLYRGKTISLSFGENPKTKQIVPHTPSFMDVSGTDPKDLVLPDLVRNQVSANIWAPIMYRERCKEAGVPFRRGVLLAGNYGVGKTLTANVVAQMCESAGITFLYCKEAERLKEVLEFARGFEPAVVFCEDVDRIAGEGRDDQANSLLNVVDGVDTKKAELMLILTTNKVESITRALLRPGRIDSVIEVTPPDAKAAVELIKRYGRTLIHPSEDLTAVGRKLAGHLPAVIREVVEKAKLGAIAENGGAKLERLSSAALLAAAESMVTQLRLLAVPEKDIRSEQVKAAQVTADGLVNMAKLLTGKTEGNGHDSDADVLPGTLAGASVVSGQQSASAD
jgi:transitional endoplasmic reticulum ATPase